METTIASTPCAFHDNSRQLQEICFRGFLRLVLQIVLSVSYLLVSYFVVNFLRRVFAVCHSFRSMYQSGRMKGFERCFKVEDQDTWRRQNLHASIFCDRLRRGNKLTFMSAISSHLAKERSLRVLNELHLGERKARYGKY